MPGWCRPLERGHVDGGVGLGAACACTLACRSRTALEPVDGQRLHHVHVFAAAVVPLAGISWVLVGEDGAQGLHNASETSSRRRSARAATLRRARCGRRPQIGVGAREVFHDQFGLTSKKALRCYPRSILRTRRLVRPPANGVSSNLQDALRRPAGSVGRRGQHFESLCSRRSRAVSSSQGRRRATRVAVGGLGHTLAAAADQHPLSASPRSPRRRPRGVSG